MARPFKTQRDPQRIARQTRPATPKTLDGEEAQQLPTQRLHKLLAMAGFGSRRDMEALIDTGRVTVNGKTATQGIGVTQYDVVRIDSRPVHLPFEAEMPEVLLYHKPEGEIVSKDDPDGRDSVFDKLPKLKTGKWISIGRLDMNTCGLLIFTTSGELANFFMHPRYEVEREYAVRVFGELTDGQMDQLREGIELDDGPASFDRIVAQGGEGSNHWYQVTLREGRNREVRRLFEAFQMPVSRLMRVRFGPVDLPSRVKRGQMLKLEQKDIVKLLEWAGMPIPRRPMKQLTQREKLKATAVFMPKVRKQRPNILDKKPVEGEATAEPYAKRNPRSSNNPNAKKSTVRKTPSRKPVKRRIRDASDIPKADAPKKRGRR